ncbi:MAG: tRNA pseudouridine(38-40) synthase TruA [Oscillospiraceae bacterium]
MRNIMLKLSYNGTKYCGFQVQNELPTIALKLQDAIEKIFGVRYNIKGCSRTDSGVHANEFVISFKCDGNIPCEKLVVAMNTNLPDDIAVFDCEEVAEDFHARYNSKGKRYVYLIHNSQIRNPFMLDLCLEYRYKLNENLMNEAAQKFIGTYDFSAFCSANSSVTDFVRTIRACNVVREGDMIKVTVEGDGFLYNMVRIIVGTLLEVSQGKISPDDIIPIIESKDRTKSGITAPPCGLYLDKVFY